MVNGNLSQFLDKMTKEEFKMNESIKTLETRCSCKAYTDKMIPEDILQEILEAGLYAPSGLGQQNAAAIVITSKKVRDELEEENARILGKEGIHPFYTAPIVVLVIAKGPTGIYDGSLMIGNMLNAASSLGIGACWIHRAKEEVEREFGKKLLLENGFDPNEWQGLGNVTLGYAALPQKEKSSRKEHRIVYVR